MTGKAAILVILDGWGIGTPEKGNAVLAARTPNFDHILAHYPSGKLKAHGEAVGLPKAQMGNSEVGHMTIGAGRVIWMELPKIDRAIASGELAGNSNLLGAIKKVKDAGGRLHIMGLASPGGVHSHQSHISALANIAAAQGVECLLHVFTDGRDVPPKSALDELPNWSKSLPEAAHIATLSGRYYAMDRDQRWERVERAYQAICEGEGARAATPDEAVQAAYARGESDEFIAPAIIDGYDGARDGDGFVFANFRADRARQITEALASREFTGFERKLVNWSVALGMVEYSTRHKAYMDSIFPKEVIEDTIGEVVSAAGQKQFRLAETEKYPHVTFFFSGGAEEELPGEERFMAPSPKVATYDLAPEMAAREVGGKLEAAIRSGEYGLIICNFANPDMVGHTGDLEAAIRACEAVDTELGKAVAATGDMGAQMIVTADHGNAECMIDPQTGGPHTAHTLNFVPYICVGCEGKVREEGSLADLAPTLLHLMGLPKPGAMSGQCLFV